MTRLTQLHVNTPSTNAVITLLFLEIILESQKSCKNRTEFLYASFSSSGNILLGQVSKLRN